MTGPRYQPPERRPIATREWGVGQATGWGAAAGGLIIIIVGGVWTAARRLRRIAGALREADT